MATSSVGYGGRLLQTYLILIGYLQRAEENSKVCSSVLAEYKAKLKSSLRRRNQVDKLIYPSIKLILDEHLEDIKEKDFGFLNKTNMTILDTDVSNLLSEFWSAGLGDELEDKVVAELLALFYELMTPEDQKEVLEAHAITKHEPQTIPSEQIPSPGNMNLNGLVDKIMKKHRDKINKAEGDPSMMNDVIQSVIQDSSGDLVKMISSAVGKQ